MEELKDLLKEERQQPWREELRKSMKAKDRTVIERVKMVEQDPVLRAQNHDEVNLGLTMEMAVNEAKRCLDCADPTCISGCPVGINIPKFIKRIESRDFLGAAVALRKQMLYLQYAEEFAPRKYSVRLSVSMCRNLKRILLQ